MVSDSNTAPTPKKVEYTFRFHKSSDDGLLMRLRRNLDKNNQLLNEVIKGKRKPYHGRYLESNYRQTSITLMLYNLSASVIHEDKLLSQRRVGG